MPVTIDAEPPVLNAAVFERTASYLAPDAVASYLRTIADRAAALSGALADPDALSAGGDRLADAAHTLAGSAGLFGFERLVVWSRCFEGAARCGGTEARALADGLAVALDATIRAIGGMAGGGVGASRVGSG